MKDDYSLSPIKESDKDVPRSEGNKREISL